jgi:hypothetical protein
MSAAAYGVGVAAYFRDWPHSRRGNGCFAQAGGAGRARPAETPGVQSVGTTNPNDAAAIALHVVVAMLVQRQISVSATLDGFSHRSQ